MVRTHHIHLFAILLVVGIGLSSTGCKNEARLRGIDQAGEESDEESGSAASSAGAGQGEASDLEAIDEQGHGVDPTTEQERIEPGFVNGSWRVATAGDDTPVAYFDTFHDANKSDVTGSFLMAIGLYDRLDGEAGQIEDASWNGNQLTVAWNPTSDPTELFTLTATKLDENTLEGAVTAKRNPNLDVDVKLTRRHVDDTSEK